jgi:hypothetical protein
MVLGDGRPGSGQPFRKCADTLPHAIHRHATPPYPNPNPNPNPYLTLTPPYPYPYPYPYPGSCAQTPRSVASCGRLRSGGRCAPPRHRRGLRALAARRLALGQHARPAPSRAAARRGITLRAVAQAECAGRVLAAARRALSAFTLSRRRAATAGPQPTAREGTPRRPTATLLLPAATATLLLSAGLQYLESSAPRALKPSPRHRWWGWHIIAQLPRLRGQMGARGSWQVGRNCTAAFAQRAQQLLAFGRSCVIYPWARGGCAADGRLLHQHALSVRGP